MFIRIPMISALPAAILVAAITAGRLAAQPVPPSDTLMPPATRGFVSIADLQTLSDHFAATQFGRLVQDEAMQPFVQDMKRQLQRKLSGVRDKLGLELGDLKDVAGGEIGLGMVEREDDRAAFVMTVDITGRRAAADELLATIDRELAERKAQKSTAKYNDVDFTLYAIPPQSDKDVARNAVFYIHGDLLVGSDNRTEAEELLGRIKGAADGGLAAVKPYQTTMQRCTDEAGGLKPELRWYVDPFGYARAARSLATTERRHGKDYLRILTKQGFNAIEGAGGFVNLSAHGTYEILHRTSVYAPPIEGNAEKYRLAMRMLAFPNSDDLAPQNWMPRKLASYRTFNVDLKKAFDHFDTLFDAIAGYDDAFEGVIEGLEVDPYGPQVKVRKDFIEHLGERLTLVTDYEVPITTESERFLFVVELKDQAKVAAAVKKFMEADPNARQTDFEGKVVWEIVEPENEFEDLEIGVFELDPLEPAANPAVAAGGGDVAKSSAVCVADGHLFIASHAEFLKRVLAKKAKGDALADAGDFYEVDLALKQLLPGPVCARCFVRTDEAYRPTYELLRQGKMPESRTLLGRILNRMLTPPEDEDEGILRQQKIDARTLPNFEMVRRYFSPAGAVIRSEDDGWLIVGATLSKQTGQARAVRDPADDVSKIR